MLMQPDVAQASLAGTTLYIVDYNVQSLRDLRRRNPTAFQQGAINRAPTATQTNPANLENLNKIMVQTMATQTITKII
ncbi:MAG: hypothetical protein LBD59_07300 [Prevotellaceae bacterium]|jgi:hypothetical protein|nr:hypothetical protein [Prevotellaceae bacterium]